MFSAKNLNLNCSYASDVGAGRIYLPGIDDVDINLQAPGPNAACGIAGRHHPKAVVDAHQRPIFCNDFAFVCDPNNRLTVTRAKINKYLQGVSPSGTNLNDASQCPNGLPDGSDGCTEAKDVDNPWPCLMDEASDHRPVYVDG
ncbi:hypothetical protein HDU90_004211 [Geranomyces variabilis]|nr:hypothetical protein HDU90_004211 [Geranomyces variabilis]